METMGYFDTNEGVDEYIETAEGYDGRELIEILRSHVPSGSSVLELGMGPGKDLALHSLWFGDELEEHHGLLFQQYTAESFLELLDEQFEALESKLYAEMEKDDSLSVVLRRID